MHFFSQFLSEKTFHTLPRKNPILHPKTLIYGAPKSGKTSLALDFAQNSNLHHKSIIYLDLNDLRISLDEAKQELLKLYLEKKIKLLIIDHFSPSFPLPNIDSILLISHEQITLPDFKSYFCPPLTFVEYISFHSKNISTDSMLKNFIKDGNLPQMPSLNEHQKIQTKQEILKLHLSSDLSLLIKLIPFQSQKLTIFQFYTLLKKNEKISKDKTYLFIEKLQKQSIIFFIPHILPNKPKKLYFYDFSIPKTLSLNPMILPILENMFVLELMALGKDVYYDDFDCFVLPDVGRFLFAPFAQREVIQKKLSKMAQKNSNDLQNLKIITLDFSDSSITHGINWEALSFVEFVLGGVE
ncbi:AAA family ATPase [Helicobacter pametensis]|uniref:AAA family ATPase n=1 Tax=Helicobacter pametensis TaxID=95149 RepID=UPI0004809FD8|nr:AAA family ATPase [Helicobacter pametensis]